MTDRDRDDASHASPEETAAAHDPNVGAGTPDTAPWEETATSWFQRQPIAAMLVAANAPLVAGIAGSVDENAPWWVTALLGSALVLVNGLGAAARRAVTPLARPRDKDGNALTP